MFIEFIKRIGESESLVFYPFFTMSMRGSRKFRQRGSNSANVFLEGERIQIPLKAGQYRPASETPFKWRLAGGSMMAQHSILNARLKDLLFFRGSGPVLLRNPIFLSFSRGSGPPVPASGSSHE